MALSRATALRTSSVTAFARSARSVQRSGSQQCLRLSQQPARRGYASAAGEAVKKAGSELPWALGAVVMTVGGSWLALQPRSAPHEDHGDEHHGDEHEEPSEEGDKPEESSGSDEPKEEESEGDPKEESSEPEEKPEEVAKSDGKGEAETPDNKGMTKSKGETVKHESAGTHGRKKRIDSDNAKDIGVGASSDTGDEMSHKQREFSNTDTKHSEDPNKSDTKSSKGEGTADSAKVKGTVKPDRPQV